jgi:hypothetical protein
VESQALRCRADVTTLVDESNSAVALRPVQQDVVTISLPSWLKATSVSATPWSPNVATALPSLTDQRRAVPSKELVAIRPPSGLNAAAVFLPPRERHLPFDPVVADVESGLARRVGVGPELRLLSGVIGSIAMAFLLQ